MQSSLKDRFYNYIQTLQDAICDALEAVDGKAQFPREGEDGPESSKTGRFSKKAG